MQFVELTTKAIEISECDMITINIEKLAGDKVTPKDEALVNAICQSERVNLNKLGLGWNEKYWAVPHLHT